MAAPAWTMGDDETRDLAREAYIYAFPLVDNYRIMHAYFASPRGPEFKAPWNRIHHEARVYGPRDKAVQTPNADTPYSQLGADLRAEPLVLTFPSVEARRYYAAQFVDQYTHNFAYVGTRTTGNGPGVFLLVGPTWRGETPPGVTGVIRCETELALVLYRVQLFGPHDLEAVKRVQRGFTARPLSEYLGKPAPPSPSPIEFPPPLGAAEERSSLQFFNLLSFVLQFCPTHPTESELRRRLAKLCIGPYQQLELAALSAAKRRAMTEGVLDAWRAYASVEKRLHAGELTSGDVYGTRAHLKNNYLYRMAGAVDGIYGNSREEAMYPSYLVDSTGVPLDGSRCSYALRFAPGQLPPAHAFWSLTMYELPGRSLVANSLDRHVINSAMLPQLRPDGDGGLTVLVQHQQPRWETESNWLPAPGGPFMIVLRLYSPRPEAFTGAWRRPALQAAARLRSTAAAPRETSTHR